MTDRLVVRRAAVGDPLDDVAALQEASFHRGWGVAALRKELTSGAGRLYRLETGTGELVGFCACWIVARELHINSLAIAPAWRRQGHARRLLQAVFREAIAEGATAATLEVRRSNVAALRLYEGLGFEQAGVRRNYYEHPAEDGLVLWRYALADPAGEW